MLRLPDLLLRQGQRRCPNAAGGVQGSGRAGRRAPLWRQEQLLLLQGSLGEEGLAELLQLVEGYLCGEELRNVKQRLSSSPLPSCGTTEGNEEKGTAFAIVVVVAALAGPQHPLTTAGESAAGAMADPWLRRAGRAWQQQDGSLRAGRAAWHAATVELDGGVDCGSGASSR